MLPENQSRYSSYVETELTLGLPGGSVELKMGSNEHEVIRQTSNSKGKYVKVSVDGNPILRKVNLEAYGSYRNLTAGLEEMVVAQGRCRRRSTFTVIFQDNDGDWMLVGDIPWRMFLDSCKRLSDSCKRLRLIDSSSSI